MPTEVWTAEDLDNVRNDLTGDYIQMADIDISGADWDPWGPIGMAGDQFFTGSYDGNDYKIIGLTTGVTAGGGLFYQCKECALKNITLENVNILAYQYGGALAGLIRDSDTVKNCHSSGTIDGQVHIGGLVGYTQNQSFFDCSSSCDVTGDYYSGDLIGEAEFTDPDTGITIALSYDTAYVGGLIGTCYVTGDYEGDGESIERCHSTGTVICGSKAHEDLNYFGMECGGLIGRFAAMSMDRCYTTGNVTASIFIGGVLGRFAKGDETDIPIKNSYARGSIAAHTDSALWFQVNGHNLMALRYMGGFVGELGDDNTTIENCYCSGHVPLLTDDMYFGYSENWYREYYSTGGFAGHGAENIDAIDNYYDVDNSDNSDDYCADPRSTAEMTDPYNEETTYIDWDFDTVWDIDSEINDGYPFLLPPIVIDINIWVKRMIYRLTENWVKRGDIFRDIEGVWVKKGGKFRSV